MDENGTGYPISPLGGPLMFLIQLDALRAINVELLGKSELLLALQIHCNWFGQTVLDTCLDFIEIFEELPILFLVHS